MSTTNPRELRDRIIKHPLLAAVNDMAQALAGVRLLIVMPGENGWLQASPTGPQTSINGFCKYIQSSAEGAKQCQMCHVLMGVGACSGGLREQRCHAGALVLVSPVVCAGNDIAVLSTCIYADKEAWSLARKKSANIGLKAVELQSLYKELPKLDAERVGLAKMCMNIMAEAVSELQRSVSIDVVLKELKNCPDKSYSVPGILEARLKQVPLSEKAKNDKRQVPVLINVLKRMIDDKPELAFSVKEISVAARVSPNYLSAIFQKHMKKSFSEYVAIRRIELAKTHLRDLTLNVTEVAIKVGYPDSGYFSRRFRQVTGVSPKMWRLKKLSA